MFEFGTDEDTMLTVAPATTANAPKAQAIAQSIIESDASFSNIGEPCNSDKMRHFRNIFGLPNADLQTLVPLKDAWNEGTPPQQQAASFISDLRCQYIFKLIEEGLLPAEDGWLLYLRNRIWHVRLREQMRLYIDAAFREENGPDVEVH